MPASEPLSPSQSLSSFDSFEEGLADELRELDFPLWPRPAQASYIQALAGSVAEAFSSTKEASSKALAAFCMRLSEAGMQEFKASASFEGSRFMVASESFNVHVKLGQPDPDAAERARQEVDMEPDPPELPSDALKMRPVWDDAQGALALWDHTRAIFNDQDGSQSARDVGLLLVHFEHLSHDGTTRSRLEMRGMRHGGSPASSGLDATVDSSMELLLVQAHPASSMRM
jgi:hypothetical protein